MSGNTLAVGAPVEDSNSSGLDDSAPDAGAVYVFVRGPSGWSQQAFLKASNAAELNGFGWSLALNGDVLAVGAVDEPSGSRGINGAQGNADAPKSGAVYVFVRQGQRWIQQAYIKASNADGGDWFGLSVALSGMGRWFSDEDSEDVLVVGADSEGSSSRDVQSDNTLPYAGAAYVFVREGTAWRQEAYLKAERPAMDSWFGAAVAVSGDTVVVGEPQSSTAIGRGGAVHVFERSAGTWRGSVRLERPIPATEITSEEPSPWTVTCLRWALRVRIVLRAGSEVMHRVTAPGIRCRLRFHAPPERRVQTDGVPQSEQCVGAARFWFQRRPMGSAAGRGRAGRRGRLDGYRRQSGRPERLRYPAPPTCLSSERRVGSSVTTSSPRIPDRGDNFGSRVSVGAAVIVVGAPAEDSNSRASTAPRATTHGTPRGLRLRRGLRLSAVITEGGHTTATVLGRIRHRVARASMTLLSGCAASRFVPRLENRRVGQVSHYPDAAGHRAHAALAVRRTHRDPVIARAELVNQETKALTQHRVIVQEPLRLVLRRDAVVW